MVNITAVLLNRRLKQEPQKTTLVSRGLGPTYPPGPSGLRAPEKREGPREPFAGPEGRPRPHAGEAQLPGYEKRGAGDARSSLSVRSLSV